MRLCSAKVADSYPVMQPACSVCLPLTHTLGHASSMVTTPTCLLACLQLGEGRDVIVIDNQQDDGGKKKGGCC